MFKILPRFFTRLSKREKSILGGTILIISFLLLDRLVLEPILAKMKSLKVDIETQKATIKRSQHILAQKDRISKEIKFYSSYVTESKSQEEEMVFLLQEIEELANNAAVYVIDIKSGGLAEEGIFKKYLVKINFEAQIEQLTKFFYNVEGSQKMLKVERYDIRPKTEGSSVVRCSASISKAVLP